jgi:long-subunit acyl-CoA synthetase (AMP-forming)
MSGPALLEVLRARPQDRGALEDGSGPTHSVGELLAAVAVAGLRLAGHAARGAPGARVVALLADNGPAWAVAALAVREAGLVLLPLPLFFSDGQVRHALRAAGATLVLTDDAARLAGLVPAEPAGRVADLALLALHAAPVELPAGASTVTFTSGTTGEPKGVCLGARELHATAAALRTATAMGPEDRHLALLPLPVLLEEVGGLHRALLAGATVVLPSLAQAGLCGSSALDAPRMLSALRRHAATSAILTPQMLAGLVDAAGPDARLPHLRFLGVGGAHVPLPLLRRARALGLPAFEGYGLTEMGSVVALNVPGADRPGSVGQPLPHVLARIAPDGEILLRGGLFLGCLGAGAPAVGRGWLHTGDLGRLDEDGFLHVLGRKGNTFITSFGRNASPEWIERELLGHPALAAAAVFGEGWPAPRAVLVPAPGLAAEVDEAVVAANRRLPDYARIAAWIVADEPFSPRNGLATANGRPRRNALWAAYGRRLAALLPVPVPSESPT